MSTDGEHWYPNPWRPNELWPSVTTVLGVTVSKPAIAASNSWKAARFAVAELPHITAMVADGRKAEAEALIAREPDRQRDEAGDIGTIVHRVAEAMVKGEPISLTEEQAKAVDPFLATLDRFVDEMKPAYEWAEATVFHRWLKYAGTLDAGVRFPQPIPVISEAGELIDTLPAGELLIMDYKSGRGVWPDAAPQVLAYGSATHMDIKDHLGTILPMPPVRGGVVVHVRPEGYRVHGVRFTDAGRVGWQAALQWFRWLRGDGASVLGIGLSGGGELRLDDLPGLNIRARNSLALAGKSTLADLEEMGEAAFLGLKYCGPAAAATAHRLLALEGRSWLALPAAATEHETERGAA